MPSKKKVDGRMKLVCFKASLSGIFEDLLNVMDLNMIINTPITYCEKKIGIITGYDQEKDCIYGNMIEDYLNEANVYYPNANFSVELKGE